ncbi:MAG TPA: 16S rRNA (adenine(1518)-N(6)/adenine(1519)-N(6))-dimethyltransferase RsmA [Anaerolineales bacterium]|nr:16S rRNA (adenine(1518)-N(6)/adenine(1519)-N(6))-dimethyltransferase RsmA [Anaerolineales bacterium]
MHTSLLDAPKVLKKYGISPKKSLGQNFVINQRALDAVISAADLTGHEEVIEVGAGLGTLTIELAQRADRVFAVEIDKRLILILQDILRDFENVSLIHTDFLQVDPGELVSRSGYSVVANIPYNITSALIRHLMESSMSPARVVLTMQREVAQRITGSPGDMSLLALSVQIFGSAKITAHIPAGCFYPIPKVDSAVLRIDVYEEPVVPRNMIPVIFSLARTGFGQKRKKLRNSLVPVIGSNPADVEKLLVRAGIQPKSRAQELSIQDWEKIARVVTEEGQLQ